jgi:type III restriction enzyme
MHYGQFLQKLAKQTSIDPMTWHKFICKQNSNPENINDISLQNIINKFIDEFINTYSQKYEYSSLDFSANTTVISSNDKVKDEIEQGLVGVQIADDITHDERNLYEEYLYDSEIEHEILKNRAPENVKVFGKLPRCSIKVPTYIGGTTTPDFVYAIEKNGNVKLTLLVEAKDGSLRLEENIAIKSQEQWSKQIKNIELMLINGKDQIDKINQKIHEKQNPSKHCSTNVI